MYLSIRWENFENCVVTRDLSIMSRNSKYYTEAPQGHALFLLQKPWARPMGGTLFLKNVPVSEPTWWWKKNLRPFFFFFAFLQFISKTFWNFLDFLGKKFCSIPNPERVLWGAQKALSLRSGGFGVTFWVKSKVFYGMIYACQQRNEKEKKRFHHVLFYVKWLKYRTNEMANCSSNTHFELWFTY